MRRQIVGTMYNNGYYTRGSSTFLESRGLQVLARAARGLRVDTNFLIKCHLEKKSLLFKFSWANYRLANPQIPTFTQPHAASINTGDTNNASILWKVPHTVLLVLSWFSNRTGKRAKRTKLDFRCPISRSAIGQASCLISARRRQITFPFCC